MQSATSTQPFGPVPTIDWTAVPRSLHIPMAAFFDLPRKVKNPSRCPCGGERSPFSATSCQRCYKRRAREAFVDKWEAKFPCGPTAAEALADHAAPLRNSSGLARAFEAAIARDEEPEAFRSALQLWGCGAVVQDRDDRVALFKPHGRPKSEQPLRLMKREVYRAAPVVSPTVAEVKAVLKRPLYPGGMWLNTRLTWSDNDNHNLRLLSWAKAPIEQAADALGRSPESIANRARDTGLPLPDAWKVLIKTPKLIRTPRIALAYPFVSRQRAEHELLLKVNAIVPASMIGREDVCQSIMLAILEGRIASEDVLGRRVTATRENRGERRAAAVEQGKKMREFISSFRRENMEGSGYAFSLDAPILDGDGGNTFNTQMMSI